MLVNQPGRIVISEEEAHQKILSEVQALPPRAVPLLESVDHFVRRDLFARIASPRFDNSSMDGYALVANSAPENARLKIIGEQPAGLDRGLVLGDGETIRILTGAPIPRGADAVIMQEDVRIEGNEIVTNAAVEPGENVRPRGADVAEGQKLVSLGERIRPATVALLASQGFSEFEIGGEVRASIVTTGDEIVQAGTALQAGQIYDSNSPLLHTLARKSGAQVVSVRHCADDAQEIEDAFRAATTFDVLIISGGVSVGARDLVKPALAAIGASLDLLRVAVKPGKPFLFGRAGSCLIFGLPGNPVSAYMTFLLFVRPALLKLRGANDAEFPLVSVPARLAEGIENPGDRPHYVRGQLKSGVFSAVGRQESHALFGLHQSNALLRLGAHESHRERSDLPALLPFV